MTDITYRWIDGPMLTDEEWASEMDRIDQIFAARGWMQLAKATTRIRIAEDEEGKIAGLFVLQLMPHLEPLFVAPAARGQGIAETLIDDMLAFVADVHIRGYIVAAENAAVERVCRDHGMEEVKVPVFVKL